MSRFILSAGEIADICGGIVIGNREEKVSNYVINSKETKENSLFIALIGEKVDAHEFLKEVFENSCKVAMISREVKFISGMTYIKVDNTLEATRNLASIMREKIDFPIVAVTGSVGKTSSRQIITKALSAGFNVYETKGNANSQIGVPLTILNMEDEAYNMAVIEMGVSEFGEMEKIAQIVRPNVAVITNIGDAHLEFFKTREAILEAKLHIMDDMKENSVLFVNGDDKLLLSADAYKGIKKENVFVNTYLEALKIIEDESFKFSYPKYYVKEINEIDGLYTFIASINNKNIKIKLSAYGYHQISNAMLALSIADFYKVDLEKAAQKISEFKGGNHRQEIIEKGDFIIIDDTYNASPSSMKAGLEILSKLGGNRKKIAVLADMKELGDDTPDLHKSIGEYINTIDSINHIYLYGDLAKYIFLETSKKANKISKHFTDRKLLLEELKKESSATILFKGSNSMKLYDLIDEFLGSK